MLKILRPTVFVALLLAVFLVAPVVVHADASDYSSDDQSAVTKLCAQKLGISQKSKKAEDQKQISACQDGYFFAIDHPKDSSPCNDSYSKDSKALHACASVGFSLGKSNSLKIKSKSVDPHKKTPGCTGSECSSTPIGNGQNCDEKQCDLISLYINPTIRVLSVIVGLVVAASLILAGIQYSAAGSNPEKVNAAKSRITNTLLAFIAYAFLYAFLNFIIPGGVFR